MSTTHYLVWRVGSNAANQPMTMRMPVGFIAGPGRTAHDRYLDGWARASALPGCDCYANQHLELVPVAHSRRSDLERAEEYQQDVAMWDAEVFTWQEARVELPRCRQGHPTLPPVTSTGDRGQCLSHNILRPSRVLI